MAIEESLSKRWLPTAVLAGMIYAGIGILFGAVAGASSSNEMRTFWRLAAWVASALVFAAHIWRENVRMKNVPPRTAWHVASAAGWGAFGLAVAANLHEMMGTQPHRLMVVLSLVVWPILTGSPAYVVAFVLAVVLKRLSRKPPDSSNN